MRRLVRQLESSRARVADEQRQRRNAHARFHAVQLLASLGVVVFAVFFIWISWPVARQWALERRADGFVSTAGTLVSVSIEDLENDITGLQLVRPVYDYTVSGVIYRNSVLRPFPNALPPTPANRRATELQSMAALVVHYNPADPQDSVLLKEPGKSADMDKGAIVIAWVVLAIASISALWVLFDSLFSLLRQE
jgi:hypothetical protein